MTVALTEEQIAAHEIPARSSGVDEQEERGREQLEEWATELERGA